MLTTWRWPSPTVSSLGRIFRASVAPRRPWIPSMRGTLKPQMSASSTPTLRPRAAIAVARFTVTLDLPTPPLPLATAITRVVSGTSVGGGLSASCLRTRCMTALRWSWVISANVTPAAVTPGRPRTLDSMSSRIWVRRGQPEMVRATATDTCPSGFTLTSRTMPRSTMSEPSSGSTTPRSTSTTSCSLGSTWGPAVTLRFYRSWPW